MQEYVDCIERDFDDLKEDPNSKLFALIYFLSIEMFWLQKPPLIFQILRKRIASIALRLAVWERNSMEKIITDQSLLIRLKFAAISVLRSADKYCFLENINNIFQSVYADNRHSKSITQNLFFHIHSYLKRDYHRSVEYFDIIIEQLGNVLKSGIIVEDNILYVTHYLRNLAEKKKYSEELQGKSHLAIIKSLKKEIENYYGRATHSAIYEMFRKIGYGYVGELIESSSNDRESIERMIILIQPWLKNLLSTWGEISGYINSVILNHVYYIQELSKSETFKHYNVFEEDIERYNDVTIGYNDKFTNIIVRLTENNQKIKDHFKQYKEAYHRLYVNIFSSKKLGDSIDSKIIQIANKFPAPCQEILEECIIEFELQNKNNTPKIHYHRDANSSLVFFPKDFLRFSINQILTNVISHKKLDLELRECEIWIKSEKRGSHYILEFKNSGTLVDRENPSGGLSMIKSELEVFEGTLNHEFTTLFSVELKFLHYGE